MRELDIYAFGSSFNPPTKAHEAIIKHFAEELEASNRNAEIWLLPVYKHVFAKDSTLIEYNSRMALLRLSVENVKKTNNLSTKMVLCDAEKNVFEKMFHEFLKRNNIQVHNGQSNSFEEIERLKSFRVGTVEVLQQILDSFASENIQVRLHWIMGADNFLDLPKWRNPEKLVEMVTLEVVNRDDTITDDFIRKSKFGGNAKLHFLKTLDTNVSSTLARNANSLAEAEKYVSENVAEYMAENKLYGFAPIAHEALHPELAPAEGRRQEQRY